MKTKPNRILTHESLELLRREVRRNAWQGRILNAVVLLVCAVVLWHVMPGEWREAVMQWWHALALKDGLKPELRTAGFGLPEWVAYGVVGTVVLLLMALKAWQCIVGPDEADTLAMPPRHDPVSLAAEPVPPWMRDVMAFFARRGVTLSREQCLEIRGICVPNHRHALVWLDGWMRKHLQLRLFMTTLLEVQALVGGKQLNLNVED